MPEADPSPRQVFRANWKGPGAVFALILIVNFIGNFWNFDQFGMYEDDYFFTLPPANWTVSDAWYNISYAVRHWPQGRPGWWVINPTIAWLCGTTGTLATHYIVLCIVGSLVAFLVYRLCSRFVSSGPAAAAALLFVVYPADASKPIIMHLTNYYIALAMMFGGLALFLAKGNRVAWALSYFVAVAVLLTYEPYYLFFALFPLVRFMQERRFNWNILALHWVGLAVVLVGVILIRRGMGEPRSAELLANFPDFLAKALSAPLIGTWTALQTAVLRPWDALISGPTMIWTVALLSFGILVLLFDPIRDRGVAFGSEPERPLKTPELAWFAGLGLVFLLVPYLYRWHVDYYPPVVTLGRLSALHLPGAVGAGMILAAFLEFLRRRTVRYALIPVLALNAYFALLIAVGFQIQRVDYAENWQQQRAYWGEVLALTRDAGDGDLILVDLQLPDRLPDTRPSTPGLPIFSLVNHAPDVLATLYSFPSEWTQPPEVFCVWSSMKTIPKADGVQLQTPPWRGLERWPILRERKFIRLAWRGQNLQRIDEPFSINGVLMTPKPIGGTVEELATRPAFDLLFPSSSEPWVTILQGRNYPR